MNKISVLLAVGATVAGSLILAAFIILFPEEPATTIGTSQPATVKTSELKLDGKSLYLQKCASCHGQDAKGTDSGPPFLHKVYEPGHHGDDAFIYAAKRGVRAHHWKFGDMPPVVGIRDDEILEIIVYIRQLQRTVGIR